MFTLTLKKNHDHRFNSGHPWIYSNELGKIPRDLKPGEVAQLVDCHGNFLAFGYAHPNSLISFRVLTRNIKDDEPLRGDAIFKKLLKAYNWRRKSGLTKLSYRLVFGEADGLPGLVIDRFRTKSHQVFVVEPHTAGMDASASEIENALHMFILHTHEKFSEPALQLSEIILKSNAHHRTLEGLEMAESRFVKKVIDELEDTSILVASPFDENEPVEFFVNLLDGQKTGFFLDQFRNVQIAAHWIRKLEWNKKQVIRILDLFCYVGQWSVQLARILCQLGYDCEVSFVDASQSALDMAQRNLKSAGVKKCIPVKLDIVKDLDKMPADHFDLVICDPPALIKRRKDIPQGERAYLKLFSMALNRLKTGGFFVAASCSGLLQQDVFFQTLGKAKKRAKKEIHWLSQGEQAADHPVTMEFPEGNYLKCLMGICDG